MVIDHPLLFSRTYMNVSLVIVDDFYTNPDEVRNFALSQSFDVKGNFPGARTKSYFNDDMRLAIERVMPRYVNRIVDQKLEYNGSFQVTTASDRTWIHSDPNNMWAGVCYLTPDAPHTGGTGLFRHRATGEHHKITTDHEGYDYTKWDLFDRVGNKYNRLIVYRGDLFHASLDYFGEDLKSGRLFQTFFFNTIND